MEEFLLAIANCFSAKCLQKWLGSRVSASFQRITRFVQLCATCAGGGGTLDGDRNSKQVWWRDVPNGWEPAWVLGFTNYTQQSIVQSTLLINIFWIDRGV